MIPFCFSIHAASSLTWIWTKTTLQKLWEQIQNFSISNLDWIERVGVDFLLKLQMGAKTYVKGIVQGTLCFDSLAICVMCTAFNIHCVIMLSNGYWTRSNNDFKDCLVKLAYCGNGIYKEMDAAEPETLEKGTENFEQDLDRTDIFSDPESHVDGTQDSDSGLDNYQTMRVNLQVVVRIQQI